MCEAEFCCDEGAYLAWKYSREQELRTDTFNQRIANQREEIRRLQKCLNDTKQSRDYWKAKAERVGKELQQVIDGRRKEDGVY